MKLLSRASKPLLGLLSIYPTSRAFSSSFPPSGMSSFYDLSDTDATGQPVSFDIFKGKVVYCVNVASRWGATSREYSQFRSLAESYGSRGLEIVLFPCPQFGGQELSEGGAVLEFAEGKGFEGTVMSIGDVVGPNARKAWSFFYEQTGAPEPGWNFKGKFLVGRDGGVKAASSNLEQDIVDLLDEKEL